MSVHSKIIHRGFLICILMWSAQIMAQIYPVQVTIISTPPRPVFLYKYTELGNTSLQASINLTDFSIPQHRSRLRVSIEGAGIKIETSPNFIPPQPLIITPGIPVNLSGSDIQAYLKPENVNVFGIDKNAFFQSGSKLPEGFYSFCLEVLDYNSGESISQKGCAFAQIFQEQPPRLLQPTNDQMIVPMNPQNVLFTWQPAPGGSPALTATSQYFLEIYQVIDDNAVPANAVVNGQAIIVYQSQTLLTTNFNLDLTTTQLITGKTYVWRVRALDAMGQDVYFNNGFSEWAWFYYGYPTGGKVQLIDPVKGYTWKKYEDRFFKWSASDKKLQSQPFDYQIKIVKVNEGQNLEDAIEQNPTFHEELMSTTQSPNGADYELTKALEPKDQYAWQVKAFTQGQEVAASDVWDFYGFPVVEKFNCGNFTVYVKRTENKDLNNLTGVGYVQLSSDENDTVSCNFTNVDLKEISGDQFLEGGEVFFDLSNRDPLIVTPDNDVNPNGEFIFQQGKLNKLGLYYGGILEIPFMHPTTANGTEYIRTEFTWYQVDRNYKIAGTAKIAANQSYNLLDPLNHTLELDTIGDIQVGSNVYVMRVLGKFILPDNVLTNDGNGYILPIDQQDQLYYMEVDNVYANSVNFFQPIKNTGLNIRPKTAIIDLSEDKSPGKLSGDKNWKGAYFPEFKAVLDKDFDQSGQFFASYGEEYNVEQKGKIEFWTTAKGLNLKWSVKEDAALRFNNFLTHIEFKMEIIDNLVQNSQIEGSIVIPFIDDDKEYFYTIPITDNGVQVGFLDQKLDGEKVVFAPFGGENKMEIDIKRAVFADFERLDCEIDITIPALVNKSTNVAAKIPGIKDFRIYGDGNIGIKEKNGKYALPNAIATEVYGYDINIVELEAVYTNGLYAITYISEMYLGNDIDDGEGGPPRVAITSAQSLASEFQPSVLAPPPTMPIASDVLSAKKFSIGGTKVHMENSLCDLEGYVRLDRNDPDWGEIWKGKITGEIKVPTPFQFEANIILNEENDKTFWYYDAYFQDEVGVGVPFIEPMNLVGFEGRMYYNMDNVNGEFKPTFNDNYGAALYLQMIDRGTNGAFIAADLNAVIEMDENDFTLTMKGDLSMFNANQRENFTGVLAKNAAAEVADEVIQAIGGIDESIDISPGKVGIKVPDLSNATFYYEEGDFYAGLSGKFTGAPGVGLELRKGDYTFDVTGDADGQYNLTATEGSNSISAGYAGSSAGSFNLTTSEITIGGGFNASRNTGNLIFDYDSKKVELDIDAPNGTGLINLVYDTDKNLFGEFAENKGKLGFQWDNTIMRINGDALAKKGDLFFESNGLEITGGLDGIAKEVMFGAKNSGYQLDIKANEQKVADLSISESGGNKVTGHAELNNQSGWGQINLTDGKMFRGELRGDTGLVFAEVDGIKLGLKGNKTYTFGGVSYDDGSLILNAEGDMTNKTGDVFFSFSGNEVSGKLNADSAYGRYVGQGYDVSASYYGPASGSGHFNDGTYDLFLKRIALDNSGAFSFSDGSISVSGSANQLEKKGAFNFDNSQYILNGYFSPDSGRLGVTINGDGFSAGGSKNGYADLNFTESGKTISVKGDANQFIGIASFTDGTISLTADNNPITEVGSLVYNDGTITYTVSADENVGSIQISDGTTNNSFNTDNPQALTAVAGNNLKVENGTISLEKNGTNWLNITKDGANFTDNGVVAVLNVQTQSTIDYQQYHAEVGDQGFAIEKGERKVKALKNEGLLLQMENDKLMKMNFDSLHLKYTDYGMTIKPSDLKLAIQAYQFGLGINGVFMDLGDIEFNLGPQNLHLQLEPLKFLDLSKTALNLNYDAIGINMDLPNTSLGLTDGIRNLTFSPGNLFFVDGDYGVSYKTLAGNIPGISLNLDVDSLSISPDLFAIKYDEIDLALNPNELINTTILGRNLKIGISEVNLIDPEFDLDFKITTGTDFLSIKNLSREFKMSSIGDISFYDGDYGFTMTKDLAANIDIDGEILNVNYPDFFFQYKKPDWGVKFPRLSAGTFGIDLTYGGITAGFAGAKNDFTEFDISDSWGTLGFKVEENSDYAAFYDDGSCTYTVKATDASIVPTKKGSNCANLPGFMTQASAPEKLEGSKSIPAPDSAQYMKGSVAEEAGGMARGTGNFYYDSRTETLLADAAVKAEGAFCLEGAMAFSSTPSEFDLDIGTKTQPVQIKPSCDGKGGGTAVSGYLHVDETEAKVATFIVFDQEGGVDFGNDVAGAGISAKIYFETGVSMDFNYSPSVYLSGAEMWIVLELGLYAEYWAVGISGSLTIAEASLSGNMSMGLQEPLNFSGNLEGHIVILDLYDDDFSMSVSQDF